MKRLTLMRHAKSSWSDPDQDDFDRPLNERGRKAAPLMGAFLAKNDLEPDVILCSTAARTKETMVLATGAFSQAAETILDDTLYLASPKTMLAACWKLNNKFSHAMMIAHNPGTQMLAMSLGTADKASMPMLSHMASKFPTAAVASFEFDVDHWRDLEDGLAKLTLYQTPKLLESAPSSPLQ